MSQNERKLVEQWKTEAARERQLQPRVAPAVVAAVGNAFRRMRQLQRSSK